MRSGAKDERRTRMQDGQWHGRRRPIRYRRWSRGRLALLLTAAVLLVWGFVRLLGYGRDMLSSRQTAEELREAIRAETPEITQAPAALPAATLSPAATAVPTAIPAAKPVSAATVIPYLSTVSYPDNPKLHIADRFKTLRKKNPEIVGWLNIDNLLDEAVVQRDQTYYMNHDALGKRNVNGAIFLDPAVSLKNGRPYSLILYGHNMKTGIMFGCLRNYENAAFYHTNPFISFDSIYEKGRYVIFSVGSIATEPNGADYVDFYALTSAVIQDREAAIAALKKASVYTCPIDVQPDDQLLLLVTCTEKDENRRVVAARRVRDGENEKTLKKQAEKSKKR